MTTSDIAATVKPTPRDTSFSSRTRLVTPPQNPFPDR